MVKCCGKEYDLDDVFAYSTNRVVRIRHRKVGVCYYSFLGLVVVYFVGVELLMLQAFKVRLGCWRFMLHAPGRVCWEGAWRRLAV